MRRSPLMLRQCVLALALLASLVPIAAPARAGTRGAELLGPKKLALYTGCTLSIVAARDPRGLFNALSGCITLMIFES